MREEPSVLARDLLKEEARTSQTPVEALVFPFQPDGQRLVVPDAGKRETARQGDDIGGRADAVSPAGSDRPARHEAVQNNPQAMASILDSVQALFLLPLRSCLSWQGAWLRLLPR
jgi:hypothetical protein